MVIIIQYLRLDGRLQTLGKPCGEDHDCYKAKVYTMSKCYARAEDSMQSVCELEKIKMTQRTHTALPFMQVQQSGSCECESEIKI